MVVLSCYLVSLTRIYYYRYQINVQGSGTGPTDKMPFDTLYADDASFSGGMCTDAAEPANSHDEGAVAERKLPIKNWACFIHPELHYMEPQTSLCWFL